MAAQSSTLYATNIRHMLTDLTPGKDGVIVHNMDDDVIRGATVAFQAPSPIRRRRPRSRRSRRQAEGEGQGADPGGEAGAGGRRLQGADPQPSRPARGGRPAARLVGAYAPASFMAHFIVFALACFVGFQVIWNVSHSLHTPLMAVTNAISGIVMLGALLQVGSGHWLVVAWRRSRC